MGRANPAMGTAKGLHSTHSKDHVRPMESNHAFDPTSSSVARKAATRLVGSFWIKPTVSVSITSG